MSSPMTIKAIRGATTVDKDTYEACRDSVVELMEQLVTTNRLCEEMVIKVDFSQTKDISSVFPSAITRQVLAWHSTAFMDFQHVSVDGALPLCIRVVLLAWMSGPVKYVYLRGARNLRPDLDDDSSDLGRLGRGA